VNLELAFMPAVAIAAAGAFFDIKSRRLPNWLCAALAVAAVGGAYFAYGTDILPGAALHALLALLAGMVLFGFGIIGGGDAKFYAAAALGLPLPSALALLGWTSAAGLALLLAMLLGRMVTGRSLALRGWDVPYGVAIFAGFAAATQLA
jgi:prepilin peptidase CpaA